MLKEIKKIILFMLMFFLIACNSSENNNNNVYRKNQKNNNKTKIEEIKDKGKLVLGTSLDFSQEYYKPTTYHTMYVNKQLLNEKTEIVGLDIEIAEKLAQELGVKLDIVDVGYQQLITALNNNEVDIIMCSIVPTPKKIERISMSDCYYNPNLVVLMRSKDKEAILEKYRGKSVQTDLMPLDLDLISDLKLRKIDAIAMQKIVAKQYVKNNQEFCISEDDFKRKYNEIGVEFEGVSIGIKKENEDLLNYINNFISKIKEDGSLADITSKYTDIYVISTLYGF